MSAEPKPYRPVAVERLEQRISSEIERAKKLQKENTRLQKIIDLLYRGARR